MKIERAIEILDPEHREHYDGMDEVNEACRMGMEALKQEAYDKAWAEYNSRIESVKKEATDIACHAAIAVPMVVVHDKLGFGEVRANRFLGWMLTWLRAINDDPDTLLELQDLVYEFYGIKLMEDK